MPPFPVNFSAGGSTLVDNTFLTLNETTIGGLELGQTTAAHCFGANQTQCYGALFTPAVPGAKISDTDGTHVFVQAPYVAVSGNATAPGTLQPSFDPGDASVTPGQSPRAEPVIKTPEVAPCTGGSTSNDDCS